MLAGLVLARAAAGLSDGTIASDVLHLEQIRAWFGRPLWDMEPLGGRLTDRAYVLAGEHGFVIPRLRRRLGRTGEPFLAAPMLPHDGPGPPAPASWGQAQRDAMRLHARLGRGPWPSVSAGGVERIV